MLYLDDSQFYNWENYHNSIKELVSTSDCELWKDFLEKVNFYSKCDNNNGELNYFVAEVYTLNRKPAHIILDDYSTLDKSLQHCSSISIWTRDGNNCPFAHIIHGDYNTGKLSLLKIDNIRTVLEFFDNFEVDIK
jgi:hypothetical protein